MVAISLEERQAGPALPARAPDRYAVLRAGQEDHSGPRIQEASLPGRTLRTGWREILARNPAKMRWPLREFSDKTA